MQFLTYFLLAIFCVFQTVNARSLLVALNNDILQVDLPSKASTVVVSAGVPVVAFDIHYAWSHVYWATDYRVYRTPLYDLQTTSTIAATGRVGSLVVDWVHHILYWTDVTRTRVEAAHLDGSRRRIVYEKKGSIGSLALDPHLGKLFFTVWNAEESDWKFIKSSDTFGSASRTLYSSKHIEANSPLVVDVLYNGLYFYQGSVNRSVSELWELNYGGIEARVKLFDKEEPPATSLALSKDGFFYSNENGITFGLWSKRHYTLVYGNVTDDFVKVDPAFVTVDENLKNVRQIRLLSVESQPRWHSECKNHVCQQECYLQSHHLQTTPKCGCGFGFFLSQDNRSCLEEDPGFFLCSTATTMERLTRHVDEDNILYHDISANIQAFDVDIKSGILYWSDTSRQAIYRALVEVPTKHQQMIFKNVTAYGVTVDWVHGNIYWSTESSITVASTDGTRKAVILRNLDAPAHMAVDPVNRYLFWCECGRSLSIRRSSLDGGDVTTVVGRGQVTCGTVLSVDPRTRTLHYLDWQGLVYACGYGNNTCELSPTSDLFYARVDVRAKTLFASEEVVKPTGIKVIRSSLQPQVPNICADTCPPLGKRILEEVFPPGVCLPLASDNGSFVPTCVCSDPKDGGYKTSCPVVVKHTDSTDMIEHYLEFQEATSFSVTLNCVGPLQRNHFMHSPFLEVTEIDSLVPRSNVTKTPRVVRVHNTFLPFTIDALNPATSYRVSVRNRVTRDLAKVMVHTAPPPLAVRRLPVVFMPGFKHPVPWHKQGIHYSSPNVWENLLKKDYILMLLSKKEYILSYENIISEPILKLLRKQIKDFKYFVVLKQYKNEEEFDDDPEMYLGNIPWGEEFQLAMVQVTKYKSSYNVDIVFSERFGLPDPYWGFLLERIMKEQQ